MKKTIIVLIAFLMGFGSMALAQRGQGGKGKNAQAFRPDPLSGIMIGPEQVLRYRGQLELTDDQIANLRRIIKSQQTQFQDMQWNLQDKMDEMRTIVKSGQIDESVAIAKLDEILAIENQMKKLRLKVGIQVNNQLTPAQKEKVKEFRRRRVTRDRKGNRPGQRSWATWSPCAPS